MRRMRLLVLLLLVATSGALLAQGEPPRTDRRASASSPAGPAASSRFRHLEGRYEVRDARLEGVFDAAVTAVVSLQASQIRDEARRLVTETSGYRFERREPLGERELRQLQPAHIPAVQVVRVPL